MTGWEILLLNLKPAKIPAGTVACAYCGKPVLQPRATRVKKHCDPVCMRKMQLINRSKASVTKVL